MTYEPSYDPTIAPDAAEARQRKAADDRNRKAAHLGALDAELVGLKAKAAACRAAAEVADNAAGRASPDARAWELRIVAQRYRAQQETAERRAAEVNAEIRRAKKASQLPWA